MRNTDVGEIHGKAERYTELRSDAGLQLLVKTTAFRLKCEHRKALEAKVLQLSVKTTAFHP